MKVFLIKPTQNISATASPFAIVTSEAGIYPPLGLLQLATAEAKRGKHDVRIIDMVAESLDLETLAGRIRAEQPDAVGVTLHTDFLADGYLVMQKIKAVSPDITVIAGGPHATVYPRETVEYPAVNYVVCGEADEVFGDMLDRIAEKRSPDDVPGVVSKANRDKPALKLEIRDLNTLVIPDYRLLPHQKYASVVTRKNPIAVMMTTRGCPYHCAYCPAGGTRLRRRDPKLVADEVEQCLSLGIEDILFFDEIFALDHRRVRAICEEIETRKLKFRWNIRTRITDINEEIVGIMKRAGCNLIQFGIESGTERIQRLMRKNLDLRQVYDKIQIVRKAGILTYGNFMLGSPTETVEEMDRTVEFAKELKLDFAVFGVTNLLPKTDYYALALKEGKIKKDFWQEYIRNPLVPIENVYWPDFDKTFLEDFCKKAYVRFFVRPWYGYNYIARIARWSNIRTHLAPAFRVLANFIRRPFSRHV